MAIGINQLEKYEMPLLTRLYVKFKLFKLALIKRSIYRYVKDIFIKKSVESDHVRPKEFITTNFEKQKKHYHDNQWAFVTNVFEEEFYQDILNHWPSINYFSPPSTYSKCYNSGFYWRDKTNEAYDSPDNIAKTCPKFLELYPWYKKLMTYFSSEHFVGRISDFTGKEMVFSNSVMTDSGPGAFVATHMDSVKGDITTRDRLQLVFFINGGEVPNTGELTLTKDNEWSDIIFRPPSVKNTMLIFNKSAEFFHGFKPIKKGAFRWAIGAGYRTKNEPVA